ncbi:MAG: hypothetical protein U1A78_21285 [Polyangia bacterium]
MCDTVCVVEKDGVLFAKNSDRPANEAQVLDWQPAREHPPGAEVRCTWLSIPQARRTHAVLLSRPYWGFGAEMAANEHGVMIGNEAVFTRHAVPRRGLTGMDLVRLAVERAASAAEAVQLLVDLIARHGQGGGCDHESASFRYFSSFLVADRRRAFVLETAGREHAIEEVRGARAISNGLTIPGFAERHSDRIKTWAGRCRVRQPRVQARAGQGRGLAGLLALLRDHGPHATADSPVDYEPIAGAMGGACMHAGGLFAAAQTVASWAARLSEDGDRHLVTATAAPCTSLFKPVVVTAPIRSLVHAVPGDIADDTSLFWRHERLHRLVLRNPRLLLPKLAAARDAVEALWLTAPPTPEEAFREGDALLEGWLDEARQRLREAGQPPSERPAYVERYWRTRDARAGLTGDRPRSLRPPFAARSAGR